MTKKTATKAPKVLQGFTETPVKVQFPPWTWDVNVSNLRGKSVRIETRDGCYRTGRFDGFVTRPVTMFGREVQVPTDLIVSGDTIPMERISVVTEVV